MTRPFLLSTCLTLAGCGLLTGCDPTPLVTGEPDRLAARRMLVEEGAVYDSGKDKVIAECNVSSPQPPPTGTAVPNATTCYWKTKSLIDYRYEHYKTNLLHTVDTGDLTGDVIALGLTTASTITPGATAARLFSALASAVLGVKSFVNEDVLQKQGVTLIISEMDSDRTELATTDAQHLQSSTYTVPVALNDLFAYYEAGTFQHAITALQAKASQSSKTVASPYTAQEVVTIGKSATDKFAPNTIFGIVGSIGGSPLNPIYKSAQGDTATTVATNLAKQPDFTQAKITPKASANTITFTYSTTETVTWRPSGTGPVTVSPETTAPPSPTP